MPHDPGFEQQIGNYRILDTLGEGGMGTVYLAEQTTPVKRRVALKLIKLGMDSKAVLARFEQERQALALMQHDGIAKVFDCGTSERGQPFFVMELVKGIPLAEFCDRNRLALPQRIHLMQQVCAAVTHAHQKGVVHRDLKPGNVLVSEEQGKLQVKIIDFGLAKAMGQKFVDSLFTQVGQIVGTPEYMAPEQADPTNQDIDTRADVYSLGVMLYELLTGQLPFSGESLRRAGVLEMQRLLREVEPPRPSTKLLSLRDSAPGVAGQRRTSVMALQRVLRSDLDWVVLKALEKDRGRRYDTANALSVDLQRYLDDEPLSAGPPSATYRLRKFVRRHRLQVSAALAVSVALVAGGIGTFVQFLRAEAEAADNAKLAVAEREAKQLATQNAVEADRMRRLAQAESYRSRIAAADLALRIPDAALAQRQLERCDLEQRRIEWRVLDRQADQSRTSIQSHVGGVLDVAASPDGKWIATIPGRALETMGIGQQRETNTVKVWDSHTGAAIANLVLDAPARAVAFTPDGSELWAVTQQRDKGSIACVATRVSTSDWRSRGNVPLIGPSNAGAGRNLTFTGDGSYVAFGNGVWRRGDDATPVLDTSKESAFAAGSLVDPSGKFVAVMTMSSVHLCSIDAPGDPLATVELRSSPSDAAFTVDGQWLVAVALSGQLAVVERATARVEQHELAGSARLLCCAPSPDGSSIAIGGQDGVVSIVRRSNGELVARLLGHRDAVNSLAYLPNGDFVSASTDGTIRVWEVDTTSEIWRDQHGARAWSPGPAERPGSVWLVPNGRAGTPLTLLELGTGTPTTGPRELPLPPETASVLLDTPRGRVLAVDKSGAHRLWDPIASRWAADSAAFVPTDRPRMLVFADDGTRAVAVSGQSTVVLLDPLTGTVLGRIDAGIPDLRAVGLTPDGAAIVAAGGPVSDSATPTDGNALRVFRSASGELLHSLKWHRSAVNALAVCGDLLASASLDGSVAVWDLRSGEQLADLAGHRGRAYDVVFADGGERVISASEDATVRVWDWRHREEVLVLRHFRGWVVHVALDAAGQHLTTEEMISGRTRIRSLDCSAR